MSSTRPEVPEWFLGAIDLHVHSRPSIFPRLLGDREVAQQAAAAGMRAVVLKAHEGSTVERAALAQEAVPALTVRGGVVLNRFVGGVNPFAVEIALAMGGQIIWMPTIHTHNHIGHYGEAGFKEQRAGLPVRVVEPVSVLDPKGGLLSEAVEVLEIMATYPGAVLNNGHLGMEETGVLFREASKRGIERMVVAHPELPLSGYSLDFQVEMADLGALIERCCLPHLERWGGFPPERTVSEIHAIGAERCVLSTDYGQVDSPPPAAGFERFAAELIEHGLSEREVELMVKRNPAELLGLA